MASPDETEAQAMRRSWFGLGKPKPARPARPHPYADEASPPDELAYDPRRVALFWLGLATALAAVGLAIAYRFSPNVPGHAGVEGWDAWTEVPLFAGLALLGFGFVRKPWAKRVTLAGWLLFAFYWGLVAQDLFYGEQADYVNFFFAIVGVYFFTYLAYHQWLSQVRRVDSHTVHFLNISTFVAAGAYFVIDKIEPIRRWLIVLVSDHTHSLLNLFGQGGSAGALVAPACDPYRHLPATAGGAGLVYCIDPAATGVSDVSGRTDLALFWYTDHLGTTPVAHGVWGSVAHFDPTGQSATIGQVSIILACTALQSIMLFVGLFMGTPASWRKRLTASAVVAVVVYVLNLLRNTGIVWFYGQGQASFWVMHDAVGKGGSLIAMVAIAFAAFAWFPEFLTSLIGVLDLPYRDGPLERALHLGKRRPEAKSPGP
ncbi:MAG: archaeosortase/exosortase family protein [Thermoplasmatota archaeon]